MSIANPTRLQVGQVATIDGQRMAVRGRVVLSMIADDGERYYWNEFNLVGDGGRVVTLVFEETETGPTWKWFELFEPLRPLGVAEVKQVRVGQSVDLGEGRLHVTLVDQTRVEHIEGEAPEGVERGDVAQYFNAEERDETFVVSWSVEEIEFYRGHDLARGRVEALFNLQPQLARQTAQTFTQAPERGPGKSVFAMVVSGVFVLVALSVIGDCSKPSRRRATSQPSYTAAPAVPVAPAVVLKTGAKGVLGGHELTVTAHAVERVVRMGGNFERHGYVTLDTSGESGLLMNSSAGSPRDWHLFRSVEPPAGFAPFDAAALRQGKVAHVGGRALQVFQVFASEVRSLDGEAARGPWRQGVRTYGLLARVNGELVMIQWDDARLQWYQGRPLAEAEVKAALAAPAVEADGPKRL
jgi:hypothetical protein